MVMNKNLILQCHIPESKTPKETSQIFDNAIKTVKRYANNIGWDYIIETKQRFPSYKALWEDFRVFESDLYLHYDKIAYVDTDVFAKNTSLDVLSKYNKFSACIECTQTNYEKRLEFQYFGKNYFNSGVFIIDRNTINFIKNNLNINNYMKKFRKAKPGRDQLALNLMCRDAKITWNRIDRKDICFLRSKENKLAPLVHLAGQCKRKYIEEKDYWDDHFDIIT